MKKREIAFEIPGGWYGNDPGTFECNMKAGNVVVDPEKVINAITWLKRRAKIERTALTGDGILLDYTIK